jgi:hypothetical protein
MTNQKRDWGMTCARIVEQMGGDLRSQMYSDGVVRYEYIPPGRGSFFEAMMLPPMHMAYFLAGFRQRGDADGGNRLCPFSGADDLENPRLVDPKLWRQQQRERQKRKRKKRSKAA